MLLVEDNPADVYLIRSAVAESAPGCEIELAGDGEKACARLGDDGYRPDLIVLDLNIPRRDGRAVLQFVRQRPRFERTAVVVLTSSPAHLATDVAEQADAFFEKPSDYDEFMALGSRVLEAWRKRQATC